MMRLWPQKVNIFKKTAKVSLNFSVYFWCLSMVGTIIQHVNKLLLSVCQHKFNYMIIYAQTKILPSTTYTYLTPRHSIFKYK